MKLFQGCKGCKDNGHCPDAFTLQAVHCNSYGQSPAEETKATPDPRKMFPYEHEMTVGDLKQFLEALDPNLPVTSSIFRERAGLIYKKRVKFSQVKVGRDCIYINSYLDR